MTLLWEEHDQANRASRKLGRHLSLQPMLFINVADQFNGFHRKVIQSKSVARHSDDSKISRFKKGQTGRAKCEKFFVLFNLLRPIVAAGSKQRNCKALE